MNASPWKAALWFIILTALTDFGAWCFQARPSTVAQMDSFQLDGPRILFSGLLGSLAPWLFTRSRNRSMALLIGVLFVGVLGGTVEALGRLALNREREFILVDTALSWVLWMAIGTGVALILSIGSRPKAPPERPADA